MNNINKMLTYWHMQNMRMKCYDLLRNIITRRRNIYSDEYSIFCFSLWSDINNRRLSTSKRPHVRKSKDSLSLRIIFNCPILSFSSCCIATTYNSILVMQSSYCCCLLFEHKIPCSPLMGYRLLDGWIFKPAK